MKQPKLTIRLTEDTADKMVANLPYYPKPTWVHEVLAAVEQAKQPKQVNL